ncbi:MAG: hypothetical protein NVSMB25_15920 [Thermoleophilaceae bacterium]
MRTAVASIAIRGVLALPGVSLVSQDAQGTDQSQILADHHDARRDCRAERDAIRHPAFRNRYGRGEDDKHAMRHCVEQHELATDDSPTPQS